MQVMVVNSATDGNGSGGGGSARHQSSPGSGGNGRVYVKYLGDSL